MILAHVTTQYPTYIADFERRHPESALLSYSDHHKALDDDAAGWSGHYSRHLSRLGHRAERIIANYTNLQEKWVRENIPQAKQGWVSGFDIVCAQLQVLRPDVLFVDDCYRFPVERITALRTAVPSIRVIVVHHGLDGDIRQLAPPDALVLTPIPYLAAFWTKQGCNAALFRHAFEPSILTRLPTPSEMADLSFIGSCSPLVHPERHAWLAEIAQAFPGLKIWTDSFSGSAMATSRAVLGSLRRGRIRRVWNHLTSPLRAYAHTAVYGLPMFAQLHASRVTLNYHISLRQRSACNMRLFEATGAGACLVTDAMDDLCQIFEPDCEVVSYENAADCIERISWLHAHPSAAAEIAERGQRRTLRDHTFHERTLLLAELIERQLRRTNRV